MSNRTKRWLFRILCLLLPCLLVAGAEALLRRSGLGGKAPVFRSIPLDHGQTLLHANYQRAGAYFRRFADRMSPMNPVTLPREKSPDEVRILCVGASALKGFPQFLGFSAPAFLERILESQLPGQPIRVINFGATALASFPVRDMTEEALPLLRPDLLIIYAGHNEFFGAFGVAENRLWNRSPAWQQANLALRRWALTDLANRLFSPSDPGLPRGQLMEMMGVQDPIHPDSPLRERAARNLFHHVAAMAAKARELGIPVMICSLPVNESALAPIGLDEAFEQWPDKEAWLTKLRSDTFAPEDIPLLEAWLAPHPDSAMGHFLLGKALEKTGQAGPDSQEHYRQAVDLDTMPWRATTLQQEALRQAARQEHAAFCDVQAVVGPAPGEAWFDDHVHLTIEGQARLARIWYDALVSNQWITATTPSRLPSEAELLRDQGANLYDRLAVTIMMSSIFDIPFMKRYNGFVADRIRRQQEVLMNQVPESHRQPFLHWCQLPPTPLGKKPVTSVMALESIRQGRPLEADALLETALHSTPPYSSWYLETMYFRQANRKEQLGGWTAADWEQSSNAVAQAEVLIAHGLTASGNAEAYAGRLYQLMEDHVRAIPLLEAARQKQTVLQRAGTDIALLTSYRETGERDKLYALLAEGLKNPETRALYQQIQNAALR
ncbi:MAG: hypothetical protein KDL31_07350 [Kiritimatiellae bacterium]|nr:hypothetical protein [Kiritimatiellia bacterium]